MVSAATWLVILSLGGNRVETRVVGATVTLAQCQTIGKAEVLKWATRGTPSNFACIETRK